MSWILERAKMFAAGLGAGFGAAFIAAFEKAFFDISADWEKTIVLWFTMAFTFWVPNQSAVAAPQTLYGMSGSGIGWGVNFKELMAPFIAAILALIAKFTGLIGMIPG